VLIMYTLWEKRKTIEHLKRRRHWWEILPFHID
jgi:hypothetical protein